MTLLATLRRYLSLDDDPAILERAERLEDPSRRRFLRTALIGTAVAATVDLDQLLWTPRPMVLATDAEVLEYGLVAPDWITLEGARIFVNKLAFASHINRTYDDPYLQPGPYPATKALTLLTTP